MRKRTITAAALLLALAAGCAAPAGEVLTPPSTAPAGTETPAPTGEDSAVMTCRLVGDGLLAEGEDGPYGGTAIFTFGTDGDTVVTVDGEPAQVSDLRSGMLLTVTWNGAVAESYPGQLGPVYALTADSGDTDDRCGLYLQVLEDLWAADPGLNEGVTQVGLDLSGLTGLTQGEKAAVAWAFGETHGLEVVTGTLEELWAQGYFTPMTEPAEGYEDSLALYQWEDGVHFTLTTDTEAAWNLPALGPGEEPPVLTAFDAQKWRSGLGAYFFSDCTAQRGADGTWTYTVGSEAIA